MKIAIPKGRLGDDIFDIFNKAFNTKIEFKERKLIFQDKENIFLKVRNADVATYVSKGSADIGVVGLDVLTERNVDIIKLLDLKKGKCKISIGIKQEDNLQELYAKPELKVATKMPLIAKRFFSSKSIPIEIIKLNGSIELAPILGLSDLIVDLVDTGNTMKENGLKVVEDIMESSAYLVVNNNSYYKNKKEILAFRDKINKLI
jgi:ATP phosphoribosyltransferase